MRSFQPPKYDDDADDDDIDDYNIGVLQLWPGC
jgi:hypothetical protein